MNSKTQYFGFEFCPAVKESVICQILKVVFLAGHRFLGRAVSGQKIVMLMQTDELLRCKNKNNGKSINTSTCIVTVSRQGYP